MAEYLKKIYGLKSDLVEVVVPEGSILRGQTFHDIMLAHNLYIIGSYHRGQRWFTPVLTTEVQDPCRLAIMGRRKVIEEIAFVYGLEVLPELDIFAEAYAPTVAGIAEVVIPPDSDLIGKTARDVVMRKTYGLGLLAIHRGGETLSLVETEDHEATNISHEPFRAGRHARGRLYRLGQAGAADQGPGFRGCDQQFPDGRVADPKRWSLRWLSLRWRWG